MNFQIVINLGSKEELSRFAEAMDIVDRLAEKAKLLEEIGRLNRELEGLRKEIEAVKYDKKEFEKKAIITT